MEEKKQNNLTSELAGASLFDWLDINWKYFELLSNQRMQMINYYITIEIVLIGAFFALINMKTPIVWAEYTNAAAIVFITLTFFALDRRSRYMIHCCEDLMRIIETEYSLVIEKDVFPFGYIETPKNKRNKKYFFTYSKIFIIQFIVIGCFGVMCIILLFFNRI